MNQLFDSDYSLEDDDWPMTMYPYIESQIAEQFFVYLKGRRTWATIEVLPFPSTEHDIIVSKIYNDRESFMV
jgi:hypothetical protein